MSHGKKRASPGATDEKSPFADVEISDEQQQLLDTLHKADTRAQLGLGAPVFATNACE
jgi:hypothetical protein